MSYGVAMRMILRLVALGLFVPGCREPDLGPLRDDLAASAAVVCAPPPQRPPHASKARDMSSQEVEAVLSKLCEAKETPEAISPADVASVHEALVQDLALVGQLRRSRLLVDTPPVDLDTTGETPPTATQREKLTATRACSPAFIGLERILLLSAAAKNHVGHVDGALARCADTIALARDQVLAGGLTDMLFANSQIQLAFDRCLPFVDAASHDQAAPFAVSLSTLRSTFPATINDVFRRDRAEMTLFLFGKARDVSHPYACERANTLAAVNDEQPLTRTDRVSALEAWRAAKGSSGPPDPRYFEAYGLTLQVLDKLIDHARRR